MKSRLLQPKSLVAVLAMFLFSLVSQQTFAYDKVVAQDGTGDYTTIQAALNAAPVNSVTPWVIFIKNGHYREKITVASNKTFIQLQGESVANVIVYYDDCSATAGGTSASASFTVNGNDFSAFNITFSNTFDYDAGVIAGISGTQAVAVLVNGDRAAFKNCRFTGNQDTLFQNKKGYYKNCYIDGIVDFIFGGGATIFDSCTIYPKARTFAGNSYITAANTPIGQTYGYVFRDCKVIGNPGSTNYVLGRPWQNSTGQNTAENKVAFLNCVLNSQIQPVGWAIWDAGTITSMITYAEYQNKYFNGNTVDVSSRVSWSSQLNAGQNADYYLNSNILGAWDPCTVYTGICDAGQTDIAVSNFIATKGVCTATFKWNLSWGIDQVKMEVFRSLVRNGAYTKIGEVTSPNDTTYNYSLTDNALPPGVQVYYYLLASKPGFPSHNSDTINVSTKPTITTNGTLGAFLQGGGLPSAAQTYTVSGVNLSDNVVIAPPANFEISLNNATWTANPGNITLPPTGGVLASTTMYVRLNAATAPGSFSGNIQHTTTGGDTVNVAVTGTSQTAPLTPPAYYRSRASGNLDNVATWETSADSATWFGASTVPTGAAEENITIMPTHTVIVNTAHVVNGKWTIYGSGTGNGGAFTINASPAGLAFANNSFLVWNRDGGTLAASTVFAAGSTFNLIGTGNGTAVGTNGVLPTINAATAFHHVIINTPNMKAGNPNFNGNLNTINGNLILISTGISTNKIRLSGSLTQVINIGGDLIVNPTAGRHVMFVLYSSGTNPTTQAVNIAGNVVVNNAFPTNITGTNGTFLTASPDVTLSSPNPSILPGMVVAGTGIPAGSYVVAVAGTSLTLSLNTTAPGTNVPLTFTQASSSLNVTDNGGLGSKTNVRGNITVNGGTLTGSSTGPGTINFSRTDGVPQFYSKIGGSVSTTAILWNVLPGAILDAGTSVMAGGSFTLNAGATLRTAGTNGTLTNITSGTKVFNSGANYVFNGTGVQNTLNNFTATIPTANTVNLLTINNPAGVTLSNPLTVDTVILTSGKLTLGTNKIIGNCASGGFAGYVVTNSTGTLQLNAVGNSDVVFPVGFSSSSYTPVTVRNAGTADNLSVKVKNSVDNSPIDPTKIVNVQWDIAEEVAGGSALTVKPSWNSAAPGTGDEASAFDRTANVVVAHWDGAQWTQTAAAVSGSNPYTATAGGFTSFSPFAVGNVNAFGGGPVLPLNLLSFSAAWNAGQAKLYWTTNNEINTKDFTIEHSADGRTFSSIGSVVANNSASVNNYNFIDANPFSSITYYRLKMNDRDGRYKYSIVVLLNNKKQQTLSIVPNPVNDQAFITHPKAKAGAELSIIGMDGRKLISTVVNSGAVQTTISTGSLSAGTYQVVFVNGNEWVVTRLIKL